MAVTVGNAAIIFALVQYLYRRGVWYGNPRLRDAFSIWGGLSVLFSLATALTALVKDVAKGFGILALSLSLFSLAFYAK